VSKQPELRTERLLLRPFTPDDAPTVKRLAGDRAVADTTLNIPHPYEEGMAEEWIATHAEQFEQGQSVTFAIVLRASRELIGAIGLGINQTHQRAEMGYWIGKPYWNNGYATEAARAVLEYGFEVQKLNRIHASYFARNPASGRVMEKIGMEYEGCFRQHVQRWGVFQDLKVRAILKEEYEGR
jgi:RimJ/RimL family protein N-acetyltransferase